MQPTNNIRTEISDAEITRAGDVLVIYRVANQYEAGETKFARGFIDFFTEVRTRNRLWTKVETGCWLDAENLPPNVGIQLRNA
jgi:hypothetical protein